MQTIPAPKGSMPTHLIISGVEPHYSVAKVAELLDVSTDWVYRRIRKGAFPIIELGDNERSNQRIAASELQRFLDARTLPRQA